MNTAPLNSLLLLNFKCFAELELPLRPLTVLTGVNGMGKSTAIQSLLMLSQSHGERLRLNGDRVRLGTLQDVLCESAQEDFVAIGINGNLMRFACDPEARHTGWCPESSGKTLPGPAFENLRVEYLSCERIGPRIATPIADGPTVSLQDIGPQGELSADVLATEAESPVPESLQHPDGASALVRDQVNAWLGEICPGARLDVRKYSELDVVQSSMAFAEGRAVSRPFRMTNVGFGLAYTFPILVAGLTARHDTLLIVENPESHLHPRAQTAMGRFLTQVVRSGAQVIVETHSEHVLNAIRLEIARARFRAGDVAVHFFTRFVRDERFVHAVASPEIDDNGRLDEWPLGFFDEHERVLAELLGLGSSS